MKSGFTLKICSAALLLAASLPLAFAETPRVKFGGGADVIEGGTVRFLAEATYSGIDGKMSHSPVKLLQVKATFGASADQLLPLARIEIIPLETRIRDGYDLDVLQVHVAPIEITRNPGLQDSMTIRLNALGAMLATSTEGKDLGEGQVELMGKLAFKLIGIRLAWIAANDPAVLFDLGRFDLGFGFNVGLGEGRQVRWTIAEGSVGFAFGDGPALGNLSAHTRLEWDLTEKLILFLQAGLRASHISGRDGQFIDSSGSNLEDIYTQLYAQSGLLVSF